MITGWLLLLRRWFSHAFSKGNLLIQFGSHGSLARNYSAAWLGLARIS
jgi:hypothetical protein